MALGPFELEDASWERILAFLRVKAREQGATEIQDFILLFKQFWLQIPDVTEIERQSDQDSLDRLTVQRNRLDAGRAALDAEILRLEGKLNPRPLDR